MEWIFPLGWLIIAVLLIIIESMTFNLYTIWFAVGAIGAMFVAIPYPDNFILQGIVFIILSILMIFAIRNLAVKKLKQTSIKTNVNSLIGKKAVVTKTIEPFKYGEVKIEGNYWTAKPENEEIIEVNTIVEIIEISGVKLIVRTVKNNNNNNE